MPRIRGEERGAKAGDRGGDRQTEAQIGGHDENSHGQQERWIESQEGNRAHAEAEVEVEAAAGRSGVKTANKVQEMGEKMKNCKRSARDGGKR